MATESSVVSADVIEMQEFPGLANAYRVRGVPKTVINSQFEFTGAVSEDKLRRRALQAVGADAADAEGDRQASGQTTLISSRSSPTHILGKTDI
jgi:hypothetical protein